MGFLIPKAPAQPVPPPMANPATFANPQIAQTGAASRQRAMAAAGMGFDQSIKTSPEGDFSKPNTARASLLGDTTGTVV